MDQIMKAIGHGPLECGTSIFKAERHDAIGKGAPWGSKSGFVLVLLVDLDLIVSKKTVHEREEFMPHTRINELVNKWHREIVFGIGAV